MSLGIAVSSRVSFNETITMKNKQTLLIGGGTVFGALAAVGLMKMWPSGNDETADGPADSDSKVEIADRGEVAPGSSPRNRELIERLGQRASEGARRPRRQPSEFRRDTGRRQRASDPGASSRLVVHSRSLPLPPLPIAAHVVNLQGDPSQFRA